MSDAHPHFNGSHSPATYQNTLGACLADASFLMTELPPGRMQRTAHALRDKLRWCISLDAEQEKKRETKAVT